MSGNFISYMNTKTPVSATQVTGSVLFNLDMQNYSSAAPTVWPDTSGNGRNFTFYNVNTSVAAAPTTVNNIGTSTAYFSTNCFFGTGTGGGGGPNIWVKAQAPSAFMNSSLSYTKGFVTRGTFTNSIYPNNWWGAGYLAGTTDSRDTVWMSNGTLPALLQAGNHYSGSTYSDVVQAGYTGESYNTWYYMSVSFDTTNGWTLYVNGILVGATLDTKIGQNPVQPVIGTNMHGDIAAATYYSRVLSATEHAQNAAYWLSRYNGATPA